MSTCMLCIVMYACKPTSIQYPTKKHGCFYQGNQYNNKSNQWTPKGN